MELLIAGGIALMGYNLSSGAPADHSERPLRPTKPYVKPMGPSNEFQGPGNDTRGLTRDFIQKAEQRWQDARDPALTGIVTPNTKLTNAMLPFFTSAKKQNTNDAVKQTRLELFTGANSLDNSLTGAWRKKREVESMFSPSIARQEVTSGGTSGNRMYEREDERFKGGLTWQNNVLPAPKVYVGKGVGVGPDVAATDGFHPMHRVLLKNVGEYKKNNLPGQVLGGAVRGGVSKRTQDVNMSVNKNPGALVYDQDRRPMQASIAAVLAPRLDSELPKPTLTKPKILGDEDRFGNPSRPGHEARDYREDRTGYEGGRDNYDRNHTFPRMNLTGAAAGVGAFTEAEFDGARFCNTDREWVGREGFLSGPKSRQAPAGQILPPTQRDMTSVGYFGGVGVIKGIGAVRKQDRVKTTLRDTQGATPGMSGTKAAVLGGTLDNVWRYRRLGRDLAKRADQLLAHTPGAGRMNLVDATAIGQVGQRPDDARYQAQSPYLPSVPNKGYTDKIGKLTTPHNKLPHSNPRLADLGLAADQLRSNPYARTLYETR